VICFSEKKTLNTKTPYWAYRDPLLSALRPDKPRTRGQRCSCALTHSLTHSLGKKDSKPKRRIGAFSWSAIVWPPDTRVLTRWR